MTQCLRVPYSSVEDTSLDASTHVGRLTASYHSSSRGPDVLFGLLEPYINVHNLTHRHRHTHAHNLK